MQTRARIGILPLSFLLLTFEAILFYSSIAEAKKQQCRLQPSHKNQQVIAQPAPSSVEPVPEPRPQPQPLTNFSTIPGSTMSRGATGTINSVTPTSTSSRTSGTTSAATIGPLPPFDYASDKIRGVNLGGWLVLEPWITPSIFQDTGNDNIVDEFTLGQFMDRSTALSILENHWNTWITEDDFVQISAAGLNHVRIPIGYWSIPLTSSDTSTSTDTDPYIPGAWPHLLDALGWAQKHDIYVIVDLHGAPGSQNGYDNSGQRTSNPVWADNPDNITRSVDTLSFMAKTIGSQVSVLELLNEGAGFITGWTPTIRSYFGDAYNAVRDAAGEDVKVMIGDAFQGVDVWTNFLTPPQAQGTMMDFHEYQVFSDMELDRSFDDHISFVCTYIPELTSFAGSNIWTVIGEWSNAVTDCAQWLNGRGIGARWDNTYPPTPTSTFHNTCTNYTGDSAGWTDDYRTFLRKYWEVQVEVGESVQGWIFWTWKAENADEWSYQKGIQGGWIPQDPNDRLYPGICS